MKRMTPLLLFFLCACARTEVALPSCGNVAVTRAGTFLHLKIRSSSELVTIHSDLGYTTTVYSPYFECVTINTDPGETFTIEDDGITCTIAVDQIVR